MHLLAPGDGEIEETLEFLRSCLRVTQEVVDLIAVSLHLLSEF